jgi:hypothetical protein
MSVPCVVPPHSGGSTFSIPSTKNPEERRAELIAEGKEKYLYEVVFYTMKNVFYLPDKFLWSYIQEQAKQGDIAIKIDSDLK